jgi:protein-tyrosine phosphatase
MASLIGRIKEQFAARSGGTPVIEAVPDYSVLFVCMGNICRSPTVEGVLRHIVTQELPDWRIAFDSAGTHAYHVGEPPDPRAQRAALRRGIDLSALRARRVTAEDFARFDLVLAMDPLNLACMEDVCPAEYRSRLRLMLEFAPGAGRVDVPDPYYGGSNGFEYVLDLAEEAAAGLVSHFRLEISRRA